MSLSGAAFAQGHRQSATDAHIRPTGPGTRGERWSVIVANSAQSLPYANLPTQCGDCEINYAVGAVI